MSRWPAAVVAAAISAWACGVAVQYGTPVDAALPAIAVIVTAVAAVTFPAIQLAVPLLIGGEIAIADERLRLLWFGLVIGVAFGAALLVEIRDSRFEIRGSYESRISNLQSRVAVITIAAILLLRWIPLRNVLVIRELLLIAIAVAIVAAMRWSTIGVAIAVAVALFTPAVPLRTLAFPIIDLLVCVAARFSASASALKRAAPLGSFSVCVMLLFFAWSGVFARALPLALRGLPRVTPRA
ncbi:MAG TPA: hypothetical protein VLU46_15815, partial [Thermoanaerobaculia bacterium]|nr:hypothetical protein [Thermoanaerobaculia bacterium]